MHRSHAPFAIAAAAAAAVVLFAPSAARAQVLTPMGSKGTLAIDQLSGFRVSAIGNENGISYAGPIGFLTQSVGASDGGNGKVTNHTTTFWLAPSADYFVIDHLSVGGLLEIVTSSHSQDQQIGGVTRNITEPGSSSIGFLPRVGWLFGITDRFGIWPRGGIGYVSHTVSQPNSNAHDSIAGFLMDIDVGFLYRVNENWFLRAAPEIAFGLGPSHSATTAGGTTTSFDASIFQFSGVAGIGVMWDL